MLLSSMIITGRFPYVDMVIGQDLHVQQVEIDSHDVAAARGDTGKIQDIHWSNEKG